MKAIIKLGGSIEERFNKQQNTLIEKVNINQNFSVTDMVRNHAVPLIRVKLTRVNPKKPDFQMRLESNLTMFIHHRDGLIQIGDLDFMIDNKMK